MVTTAKIISTGGLSVGTQPKTDKKSKTTGGFESIINTNIENKTDAKSSTDMKNDTVKNKESNTVKNTSVQDKQDKCVNEKENIKSDNTYSEDVNSVDTNSDSFDKDEFTNCLEQVQQMLRENIKEALDISDDELDAMLCQAGLNILQLLEPQNIKEFAVAVNGQSDLSTILTDENVLNTFNAVTQAVQEVPVEEITNLKPEEVAKLADDTVNLIQKFPELDKETLTKEQPEITEEVTQPQVVEKMPEKNATVKNDNDKPVVKNDEELVKKDSNDSKLKIQVNRTYNESENDGNLEEGTHQEKKDDSTTATKNYETFVENLTNSLSSKEVNDNFAQKVSQVREMNNIVNQIVEQIKVNISPEKTSMELVLNPVNLGKVNLSVTAKSGAMTAQFIVENENARQAIESQMQVLRENLESQGVKVEAVEVTISNMTDFTRDESSESGSNGSNNPKKHNRAINLNMSDDMEMTDDEQIIADMMKQNGTSVDYTA